MTKKTSNIVRQLKCKFFFIKPNKDRTELELNTFLESGNFDLYKVVEIHNYIVLFYWIENEK